MLANANGQIFSMKSPQAPTPVLRREAIPVETYRQREPLFGRMIFAGLAWGDLVLALRGLGPDSAGAPEDWRAWHRAWSEHGASCEAKAQDAAAAGYQVTAMEMYRRAAACHHFAQVFSFDDPAGKLASRRRVTELFERAIPGLPHRTDKLEIGFRGLRLPGYLLSPVPALARPCVVMVNGGDSAKEVELLAFAQPLLKRGMAVALFDGPGQGELLGVAPMVVDFEAVVREVLRALGTRDEVDGGRIGLCGISFGGYLAARAAACNQGIRACATLSGGFDHDNFGTWRPPLKKNLQHVFGVDDPSLMERIAVEELNLRQAPRLRSALLCLHGEHDEVVPLASCRRLLDWADGARDLVVFPSASHVCTDHFPEILSLLGDWLSDRLGASRDEDLSAAKGGAHERA